MSQEKTNTKTLEIKNVAAKLDSGNDTNPNDKSLGELTDPTLKANKEASKKDEMTRKILLSEIKQSDEKEDTSEIEFSASTAVFQLTPEMKNSLNSGHTSADSTVKIQLPNAGAHSEDEIKAVKLQVKKHYIKKARVLEAEVSKILQGFKTNNPTLQKQIDKIRYLLAQHSGRVK